MRRLRGCKFNSPIFLDATATEADFAQYDAGLPSVGNHTKPANTGKEWMDGCED